VITVLVTYKLPEAMNRAAAHALSEQVAPRFQVLEGLRMKHFLYQEERGLGGGFYTWDTREAADTFHTEMWLDSMEERMGSRPELQYFETAVVVDNNSGEVWVEAA
tara:strand:- start:13 stop:330 length:318 start_codon:yes stop_codon:yes gene_type:complete